MLPCFWGSGPGMLPYVAVLLPCCNFCPVVLQATLEVGWVLVTLPLIPDCVLVLSNFCDGWYFFLSYGQAMVVRLGRFPSICVGYWSVVPFMLLSAPIIFPVRLLLYTNVWMECLIIGWGPIGLVIWAFLWVSHVTLLMLLATQLISAICVIQEVLRIHPLFCNLLVVIHMSKGINGFLRWLHDIVTWIIARCILDLL